MMSAMSSVNSADESPSPSSSTLLSRMSPWLMLPPAFEGGDVVYKFYSLAENKVVSLNKRGGGEEESECVELPDDSSQFVGSSHGWLALFNQRNNDLFLSNPITRRHIKLPPIHNLPDPEINLRDGQGHVSKVILSCSPDEQDCRAIMSFGPGDRLAFCFPGRSTHWTPIGELFFLTYERAAGDLEVKYGRAYEDFVYCSRRKLFSCITQFAFNLDDLVPNFPTEFEDWDLRDPASPKARICYWMPVFNLHGEKCPWLKANKELLKSCRQIPYLVFAEHCNKLFIVIRFVMQLDDNSEIPCDPAVNGGSADIYPYRTIGFSVLKVVHRKGVVDVLRVVEGGNSLDGLAMFIGMNHSFAMSAAEFPELNPNSIYFTDANRRLTPAGPGGHDIGIFDYENKSVSPCAYYPCDDHQSLTGIVPPPMWFTPSQY